MTIGKEGGDVEQRITKDERRKTHHHQRYHSFQSSPRFEYTCKNGLVLNVWAWPTKGRCTLAEPFIRQARPGCSEIAIFRDARFIYATTPCPQSSPPDPTSLPIFSICTVFSSHHLFANFHQISSHSFLDSRPLSLIPLFPTQSLFQQSYLTFPRESTSRQLHQVCIERDFIIVGRSSLFTAVCSLSCATLSSMVLSHWARALSSRIVLEYHIPHTRGID